MRYQFAAVHKHAVQDSAREADARTGIKKGPGSTGALSQTGQGATRSVVFVAILVEAVDAAAFGNGLGPILRLVLRLRLVLSTRLVLVVCTG